MVRISSSDTAAGNVADLRERIEEVRYPERLLNAVRPVLPLEDLEVISAADRLPRHPESVGNNCRVHGFGEYESRGRDRANYGFGVSTG
jgi:hypothetical protein